MLRGETPHRPAAARRVLSDQALKPAQIEAIRNGGYAPGYAAFTAQIIVASGPRGGAGRPPKPRDDG